MTDKVSTAFAHKVLHLQHCFGKRLLDISTEHPLLEDKKLLVITPFTLCTGGF